MATTREAVVICVDVGPEMQIRHDPETPTPLEQATECLSWILQRKIFTESKDEFAVVLFGTEETDNPLALDSGGYSNICVARELQTPTWDLVKYVRNELAPQNPVQADFMDAIVVSLDLMATSTMAKKYAAKQLILFSNLSSPFADNQIDTVTKAIKRSETDFVLFGPRLHLNDDDDEEDQHRQNGASNAKKTQQQELGERFAAKILEQVDGESYTFAGGLALLKRFITRAVRPTPWKCNFEIGTEIKIPVCMYVKTKRAKIKQSWKWGHAHDLNADVTIQKTFHKKDEDAEVPEDVSTGDQGPSTRPKYPDHDEAEAPEDRGPAPPSVLGKELEKDDLIKGFFYGNTVVPLDQVDVESMKYRNTEKCLKLLAFVDLNQAKRQYFMGDGSHVVFSDGANQEGTMAFSTFWTAMRQEKRAAVVRYAYSARSAPRMGVLIPSYEGDQETGQIECFVFVQIPYAEDCRLYTLPTLNDDKIKPTDDQLKIIDDLITSMDLTSASVDERGRRCEAFAAGKVFDPYIQNIYSNMAFRATYENQPLPPVDKQLAASIQPLEERLNLTKPVFDKLRRSFVLTKVEMKKEKRAAVDIFRPGEASSGGPPIKIARVGGYHGSIKISSVRPAEEFVEIIDQDKSNIDEAIEQLQSIISQFIFDAIGVQFYGKAIDCIDVYRRKSIEISKPGMFNGFLRKLKRRLFEENKKDFLEKLASQNLGLISQSESDSSNVTEREAVEFFQEEEQTQEVKRVAAVSEEPNLLDELE